MHTIAKIPFLFLLVGELLLSQACTRAMSNEPNDESQPSRTPAEATTPPDYEGPPMRATLQQGELRVVVTVRSGGHQLDVKETGRDGDHTFVKLCLTTPADNESVTMALEDKEAKIVLQPEPGPVHVLLQQRKRGAEYFVEPEFDLAKIVPR